MKNSAEVAFNLQAELAASKAREMALLGSIETANADLAALREDLENRTTRVAELADERNRLREELAELGERYTKMQTGEDKMLNRVIAERDAAEQRNAAILGKKTKCKECGSDALLWFANNTNTSGVVEGRLRTSEVTCTFVMGCADCSTTINTARADTIAERMTAALKPTESGASE